MELQKQSSFIVFMCKSNHVHSNFSISKKNKKK